MTASCDNLAGTLTNVHQIKQDRGDMDCGPTCTLFFRFGGRIATDAPMEAGQSLTGQDIRDLQTRIKDKAQARDSGTVIGNMPDMLNEFAAVYQFSPAQEELHGTQTGAQYRFRMSSQSIITRSDDSGRSGFRAVIAFLDRLLLQDPRGVLIPIFATEGDPREREEGDAVRGGQHWVVYVGRSNRMAHYYDPGGWDTTDGPSEMELGAFALKHLLWCEKNLESDGAADDLSQGIYLSRLVSGSQAPAEAYINSNTPLGQIDFDSMWDGWTASEGLTTSADAIYFNNPKDADTKAEELANEGSAVVIEKPDGIFAAVQVNDIGAHFSESADEVIVDSEESAAGDYLIDNWDTIRSIKLLLGYVEDGERSFHEALIYPDDESEVSHRT
jgi:hypothetical protein